MQVGTSRSLFQVGQKKAPKAHSQNHCQLPKPPKLGGATGSTGDVNTMSTPRPPKLGGASGSTSDVNTMSTPKPPKLGGATGSTGDVNTMSTPKPPKLGGATGSTGDANIMSSPKLGGATGSTGDANIMSTPLRRPADTDVPGTVGQDGNIECLATKFLSKLHIIRSLVSVSYLTHIF